jgi:hypothetical protein
MSIPDAPEGGHKSRATLWRLLALVVAVVLFYVALQLTKTLLWPHLMAAIAGKKQIVQIIAAGWIWALGLLATWAGPTVFVFFTLRPWLAFVINVIRFLFVWIEWSALIVALGAIWWNVIQKTGLAAVPPTKDQLFLIVLIGFGESIAAAIGFWLVNNVVQRGLPDIRERQPHLSPDLIKDALDHGGSSPIFQD